MQTLALWRTLASCSCVLFLACSGGDGDSNAPLGGSAGGDGLGGNSSVSSSGGRDSASGGTGANSHAGGSAISDGGEGNAGPNTNGTGGSVGNGSGETGPMVGIADAHNAIRAQVDVGPLTWSDDIAAYAQQWADEMAQSCTLRHRSNGLYGENLAAFGSSSNFPLSSPTKVVDTWASEKSCWTYGGFLTSDACNQPCDGCGHYTQVVWEGSQRIGCGRSTCTKDDFKWELWVCNYDPPGNFVGDYPYE